MSILCSQSELGVLHVALADQVFSMKMVILFLIIVLQIVAVVAVSDKDLTRIPAQNYETEAPSVSGDSSTNTNIFDFNITNVNGLDLSDRLTIYRDPFVHSRKFKRDTSRKISGCDKHLRFSRSWCTPEISPQAYILSCMDLLSPDILSLDIPGRCASHEICVNGNRFRYYDGEPLYLTAYCVSTNNFVTLAKELTENGAVQIYDPPVQGKQQVAIEAMLTGLDITSPVIAQSLRIQAQSVKELFGSELHTTLAGGMKACTGCTDVFLKPVPAGTRRVQVDVVLPALVQRAKLFLVNSL